MKPRSERERGIAMILVAVLGVGLMILTVVSLQMSQALSVTRRSQAEDFAARQIAESAAAHAIARIKEGGVLAPMSGGGGLARWVSFADGGYYYYSVANILAETTTIRAWGRIAVDEKPSSSIAAPDSILWDGDGWLVRGIEITLQGSKYIPESPLYFGNGGIERPLGGFEWTSGTDATDPSTWGRVSGGPASFQDSDLPFETSSLNHPPDFLYGGGAPAPTTTNPHPYKTWASQNMVGQFNIEAWFNNSGGLGNDPTANVTPPPTSSYYDMSDRSSPDYAYPIDPNLPDVQSFAGELWSRFKDHPGATKLGSGQHDGTYGDLDHPGVTFVTGKLEVDADETFRGAGILVIRDDYDPNVDTNNRPGRKADMKIRGKFEWTGLVIVAGWAPTIEVTNDRGAEITIVGSLFGEDSVQSGGEVSLDSATIILKIRNTFRAYYSNSIFERGGLVHSLLPSVSKEIVGIRDISHPETLLDDLTGTVEDVTESIGELLGN